MSKVLSTDSFIFNTDLGNVSTEVQRIQGYDVEDLVINKAKSQAVLLQLVNEGKNVDVNAETPEGSFTSVFSNNEEVLE